jgi:hypothetical protein
LSVGPNLLSCLMSVGLNLFFCLMDGHSPLLLTPDHFHSAIP